MKFVFFVEDHDFINSTGSLYEEFKQFDFSNLAVNEHLTLHSIKGTGVDLAKVQVLGIYRLL